MAVTDVGIDLGTSSILVYVRGRGVVLKEPSIAAYDRDDDKIRAIGEEARIQLSRSEGNLTEIHPLENGIIADYVVTEQMLRTFIQKAVGRLSFRKPRVCICIPVGLTAPLSRKQSDAFHFVSRVYASASRSDLRKWNAMLSRTLRTRPVPGMCIWLRNPLQLRSERELISPNPAAI